MPFVRISYSANSQPSSYNQNNYSQTPAYGQQQQGYQAQQSSYSQQPGYPQQSQQQQAPPAYPPQGAGSYGQPPSNQYSQSGGPPNYNQSNHYSKPGSSDFFFFFFLLLRILSLHNFVDNYRQEGQSGGSGYSGPESRYPGAGDSRGPGRDGFDRGGMMHRVRGGMGRGMG